MGPLICPLEYGHHHSLTNEVYDLRDERESLRTRLKGAQAAVQTLTTEIETLTAKVQENSTLAEAAVFVGKQVIVKSKSSSLPLLLGLVTRMEVNMRQGVTLHVAPQVTPGSRADSTPLAFGDYTFEEIG